MKNMFVGFEGIAEKVFKPIYPVIASDIVKITDIKKGICLDVGSGTALLSRSLAKMTNLKIIALDKSYNICRLAKHYIKQEKLSIEILTANVEHLPIKTSSVDLIISRGSMFFWENNIRAFGEIYRILKPGGMTYIGGGFGNATLKMQIIEKMKHIEPSWGKENGKRLVKANVMKLKETMIILNIQKYKIIHDDRGLWILITKT